MASQGHGSQQSNTAPWGAQGPYLRYMFRQAKSLYQNDPFSYYPGQTVAGFTPDQLQAQNLAAYRAQNDPLLGASESGLMDTMSGKYLNPDSNPNLGYYTQRAFQSALPQFDKQAEASGRYGSDAWATGKATTMADIVGNIYGGAYNQERANQMQAYQAAPQVAQQDWNDISNLAAVGQEQQNMNQANINADMQKYQYNQIAPWQQLGELQGAIQGNYGGTVQGYGHQSSFGKS